MTEDEAKTKWCPFARISDGEPPVTVNRPEPYGDVPRCLASACMAWREGDIELDADDRKELPVPAGETNPPFSNCPPDYKVQSYGTSRYYVAELNSRVIHHGYCGLAGKP